MNLFDVLRKPVMSEKADRMRERHNQVTFRVAREATKAEIKRATEEMFGVSVVGVRTCVTRGKVRRRGSHAYRTPKVKKAIVTLAVGQTLSIFEN